jgi:hypothetical protein
VISAGGFMRFIMARASAKSAVMRFSALVLGIAIRITGPVFRAA